MKLKALAPLLAVLLFTLGVGSAHAADLHVETTGTDSPTCGPLPNPACLSLAQATTNAASGDRILIGTGTFVQTNVVNPGNKSIEYIGNGPDNTILSGGDSNAFAQNGMIRFQYNGITGVVRDLTISHMGRTSSASASRFGVWVQPSLPAPANSSYAINATVDNVRVIGNTGTTTSENAVYAASNAGSVSITNNELIDVMGNSILLEQQKGAATVTGNTITKPLSSLGSVIFDMTHANSTNTEAWDVTGKHTINNNTITAAAGVAIMAGWPYTSGFGPSAFLGGVEISGNTINTSTSNSSAIALINATNANDGTPGRILDVTISGNALSAAGSGVGINLQGGIAGAQLTNNNVRGHSRGIVLNRHTRTAAPNPGTFTHEPSGAVISANQLVGNGTGLWTDTATISADVSGNWWGCNAGPSIRPTNSVIEDCDYVVHNDVAHAITLDNWIVLGINASPASVLANNGAATVTAGFDKLNTGAAAPAAFSDGTVLPMSASGGVLADAAPTLTSGLAGTTFTSSGPTGRSVAATFDNQSVVHQWSDNQAPQVTITSPTQNAIVNSSSTVLTYAVSGGNGPVSCSPPSGTSVPLAVGVNTIFITCTDAFGNTAVASVSVHRPDALPACARDVAITEVTRVGSRTRIRGIARVQYAGQKIKLQYQPSGKRTIATPKISASGTWSAVVKRARRPAWTSNQARYRATLGRTTTSWIKLSRRMNATAVTYNGNGGLKVTGSVALPIAKGQPVRIQRSDACGKYRQIGSLRMKHNGTFGGTIRSGGGSEAAVYIRIRARVAKSSNRRYRFNTYSIVQPVVIER